MIPQLLLVFFQATDVPLMFYSTLEHKIMSPYHYQQKEFTIINKTNSGHGPFIKYLSWV
jgi:hypothetical protein